MLLANSVIKALRRLTYGTHSETGSRFVETVQTILETCRQQGRDPIAFIEDAITPGLGKDYYCRRCSAWSERLRVGSQRLRVR